MFNNLFGNNLKLVFIIILLIIVFYHKTNVRVKENSQLTPNCSSKFNVEVTNLTVESSPKINKISTEFNVFSENCKIPRVDPFFAKYQTVFKIGKLKICTDEPDLFSVQYDRTMKLYIIYFNESLAKTLVSNISDYGCAYYEISRGSNNVLKWNKKPIHFKQSLIVPSHIQGIIVECHKLSNKSQIIQRDAFPLVQYPTNRNEKNDAIRSQTHPSVIWLGIGAMSQINFRRTMPLTAKFMQQLGSFEMRGYTKTSAGTFFNMLTLLTGSTSQKCDVKSSACLDVTTFIWNHFQNAGYLTAFAEDKATFDFQKPQVDYYLHPFLSAIERIMGRIKRYAHDFCLGRRQSFKFVFDYCLHMVERFVKETPRPLFGIFWTNSFSQKDFRTAASIDKEFVGYLERYKKLGLFERAIVILFSDEGQWHGPLMRLKSSFLEERLPMMHIHLPPWFRDQHPEFVKALELNSQKLSTPLDLHLTMKHLLVRVRPGMSFSMPHSKNQSLFCNIPDNRSCKDAFIPNYLCTCEPYEQVPRSDVMENLAKLVVYRINQHLNSHDLDGLCNRLEFSKLWIAERMQHFDANGTDVEPPGGLHSYLLKFTTRPKGLFHATAMLNQELNFVKVPKDLILGFDPSQANCVKDFGEITKKFCVCK